MLIDARDVPSSEIIDADLCVVGAGAAGITLALQFIDKPYKVVVLEAGGLKPDSVTQSLYAGDVVGLPCVRPDLSRSRFFGGSTNCWGGWCRPLDEVDMLGRTWIPNSGWPITRRQLQPYYEKTHEILQLGSFNYTQASWIEGLASSQVHFFPLNNSSIDSQVCLLSPPARFGSLYRERLKRAANIHVFLHANVTEIHTDPTASTVTAIDVAALSGSRFSIVPRVATLCSGGIENARLLLASNGVRQAGLGNAHDVVGRYFMDHPSIRMGVVRLQNQRHHRRLYDNSLALTRRRVNLPHIRVAAHLAPTEQSQRELSLSNSRSFLVARYFHSVSESYIALKAIRQTIRNGERFGLQIKEAMGQTVAALPKLLLNAPQLTLALLDNRLNPDFVSRSFQIETIIEPVPNPESRVTLSDKRDQLGVPRVRVDWRLTEDDKRHFKVTHDLVTSELENSGAVMVTDKEEHVAARWPEAVQGCWHHMGTTRMHLDPKRGVVDADCRVHGMSNLFVAGSSVFPTGGSDTPTITIVALALRLAEKLQTVLR